MTPLSKEELRKQIRHTLGYCVYQPEQECEHIASTDAGAEEEINAIMSLFDLYSKQREVEARIIENESMKESVAHGYTWDGRDWCHNHDKHVSQCYGCREAKWGNIFCKRFAAIIDERLADLRNHQPLSPEQRGKP